MLKEKAYRITTVTFTIFCYAGLDPVSSNSLKALDSGSAENAVKNDETNCLGLFIDRRFFIALRSTRMDP